MTEQTERQMDNVIFVGDKPLMSYVTGVVMQFTEKDMDEVIIKARGKFISKAVDIAEVATRMFLIGKIERGDIKIDSEMLENNEKRNIRLSIIEITLKKKVENAKEDKEVENTDGV